MERRENTPRVPALFALAGVELLVLMHCLTPRRQVPGNAVERPEKKLAALDAYHDATSKPRWEHDLSLPFDFRDSAPGPGQKSQLSISVMAGKATISSAAET